MGRWRGEAGRREAGAAARRGLRRGAAAAARSSLRPWPRRGCSDAGKDRRASRPLAPELRPPMLRGRGRALLPAHPLSSPVTSLRPPFFSLLGPALASRRALPRAGCTVAARPSAHCPLSPPEGRDGKRSCSRRADCAPRSRSRGEGIRPISSSFFFFFEVVTFLIVKHSLFFLF